MHDRVNVMILLVGIALMAALVIGIKAGERVATERMDSWAASYVETYVR